MKRFFFFLPLAFLFFLASPLARADYCDAAGKTDSNSYRRAYCSIQLDGNPEAEETLYAALKDQLEMERSVIKAVLKGESVNCDVTKLSNQGLALFCDPAFKAPIKNNSFHALKNHVETAYAKEKALQQLEHKLAFEFRSSEKYWDGTLSHLAEAPFDLMTDLNLLETLLFGSRAKWTNDVFTFPVDEDDDPDAETPPSPGSSADAEENAEEQESEAGDDGGVTLKPTSTPAPTPPGCESDEGDPGKTPLCGNGIVDVLAGETCDDGNETGGDGCSAACLIEGGAPGPGGPPGGGPSAQCADPEAITFQPFDHAAVGLSSFPAASSPTSVAPSSSPSASVCPPGTHPIADLDLAGPPTPSGSGTPQSEASDNIAPRPLYAPGALQTLPPSRRPACLPGQSELKVSLINGQQESVCIRTELCDDLDSVRDLLFGKGWEKDPTVRPNAESIEAFFCVEVLTQNRPVTPYAPNEGCVACHLAALADASAEALSSNVTPLENTTNAFSISNRWGPNASFDLSLLIRSRVNLSLLNRAGKKAPKGAFSDAANGSAGKGLQESSVDSGQTAAEEQDIRKQAEEARLEAQALRLKAAESASGNQSFMAMNSRVTPLLGAMADTFAQLQKEFQQTAYISAQLAKKKACSF